MNRRQAEYIAWAAGGAGLMGTALGWSSAPAQFPYAWLAAMTAWLGWPVGCMGLLLIHALTGGRWGYELRPQLLAGMSTLVLLLVAPIPWLLVLPTLYPWMHAEGAAHLNSHFYLNWPFFAGRGLAYLVIWLGLGWLIARAVRRAEPDVALARLAPAGLILLVITVTYASVDTTMSLDPQFASSVYGLIAISGMGLLALSVSLLAAVLASPADAATRLDLGKLLMGLVLLWAYLDFVQVLIVWQSNLATEASWYAARSRGGWAWTAVAVTAGHFVLPFLALLWPRVRRSTCGIGAVAALLILSEVIRSWWLVVPASRAGFGFVDVTAMLGLLGVAAALALRAPLLLLLPATFRGRHVR